MGQAGDKGWLDLNETENRVYDTQKAEGLFLHAARLNTPLKVGATVVTVVENRAPASPRRKTTVPRIYCISRCVRCSARTSNSVARWLNRAGCASTSRTSRASLREKLREIEALANAEALHDFPVEIAQKPIAEAKAMGAMALFGEKYGDVVRVVKMGPSVELCGGTHVKRTGEIGYIRVLGESSISAGVRRIEALTGLGAVEQAREDEELLSKIAGTLKTRKDGIPERLKALHDERAALEKGNGWPQAQVGRCRPRKACSPKFATPPGTKLLAAQLENADRQRIA